MVNNVIVNYLREHKGKYETLALKEKVISQGYSESDFEDALRELENEKLKISFIDDTEVRKSAGGVRWIRIAGFFGFVLLALNLVLLLSNFLFNNVLIFFLVISAYVLFSVLFYSGFFRTGKYLNSKAMKFSSISLIVISIVSLAIVLVFTAIAIPSIGSLGSGFNVESISELFDTMLYLLIGALVILSGLFLFYVAVKITFAISLIRVRGIRFSKISAVCELLGIFLAVVFILSGFLKSGDSTSNILRYSLLGVSAAASLAELLFLFSSSKRFE